MAQKKNKLQELIDERTYGSLVREAVEPANFYGRKVDNKQEGGEKRSSEDMSSNDNPIVNIAERMQQEVAKQANKVSKSLAEKEDPRPLSEHTMMSRPVKTTNEQMLKFASYIPVETHKALKLLAIQEDKKMYEVIRDAIEYYMKRKLS